MRRTATSARVHSLARLLVGVVAALSLAAVLLALLFADVANARPAAPSPRLLAQRNAEGIRELAAPFVIAALPDTQAYTVLGEPGFEKQVQWLLANAESENVVFVTHLGDVVDVGDDSREWTNALRALEPLLSQDRLPFSIIPGNHDDPVSFAEHLPLLVMKGKPWFVAASPSGLCQAQMFRAGQSWFLHVGLANAPSDEELQWADDLLARPALAGLPVIVSTHDYLEDDGRTRVGRRIWESLIKHHPMIFMVLSGHIATEAAFVSRNAAGLPVYEMLSDYQQFREFGGNGLMRLITIDPANDVIRVRTFSPYFQYANGDEPSSEYYETDADSEFEYRVEWGSDHGLRERLAWDEVLRAEGVAAAIHPGAGAEPVSDPALIRPRPAPGPSPARL